MKPQGAYAETPLLGNLKNYLIQILQQRINRKDKRKREEKNGGKNVRWLAEIINCNFNIWSSRKMTSTKHFSELHTNTHRHTLWKLVLLLLWYSEYESWLNCFMNLNGRCDVLKLSRGLGLISCVLTYKDTQKPPFVSTTTAIKTGFKTCLRFSLLSKSFLSWRCDKR